MRLARRTTRRLIVTTVVVCLLGVLIVLFVSRIVTRVVAADRLSALLRIAIADESRRTCSTGHPSMSTLEADVRFHYYDGAGAALSPGAPGIDPHLWKRLVASTEASVGRFDIRTRESRALMRLGNAGPCVFAQAIWHADDRVAVRFGVPIAVSVTLIVVVLTTLVSRLVVRPLVRRFEMLQNAAHHIGTADYPTLPAWDDEAGSVAEALSVADARVRAEGARLVERSNTLARILAELTHDVRTPLASLQFALDEVAEHGGEEILPPLRRALADIVYIKSLTSNLRLAHRIGHGVDAIALRSEPCDLGAIAKRVIARARPFAMRRGMEIDGVVDVALHVLCDLTAVEQALTNLVENAIAHCEPGTRIRVALARDATSAQLIVEDDGAGLVPEHLPRLGELAFTDQHGERARDTRGTGLGLAITREVCERSGFRIRFERREPRGLRVVIDIPPSSITEA